MSDDAEKSNVELERLERLQSLVDRYAQSRSLGLWVPAATAIGVPAPFGDDWVHIDGKSWVHTCYVSLAAYIVVAGLITAVVVHIYNRKVLRRIKEMRPFDGQQ